MNNIRVGRKYKFCYSKIFNMSLCIPSCYHGNLLSQNLRSNIYLSLTITAWQGRSHILLLPVIPESENMQNTIFLPLKWPPFLKVKVIPGQGAPYPKQCPCQVLLEEPKKIWRKVQFSIQNGQWVESWAIWLKFCTALKDHPRYVYMQNIIGISVLEYFCWL